MSVDISKEGDKKKTWFKDEVLSSEAKKGEIVIRVKFIVQRAKKGLTKILIFSTKIIKTRKCQKHGKNHYRNNDFFTHSVISQNVGNFNSKFCSIWF